MLSCELSLRLWRTAFIELNPQSYTTGQPFTNLCHTAATTEPHFQSRAARTQLHSQSCIYLSSIRNAAFAGLHFPKAALTRIAPT